MQPMHRGSALARRAQQVTKSGYVCAACSRRTFQHQTPLQEENTTAPYADKPAARPANRRQGAQMAGRMIQGLRGMAPGGFGGAVSRNIPRSSVNESSTPRQATQTERSQAPSSSRTVNIRQVNRKEGLAETSGRQGNAPAQRRRRDKEDEKDVESKSEEDKNTPEALVSYLSETTDAKSDTAEFQRQSDEQLLWRFSKRGVIRYADEAQKQRISDTFQKAGYRQKRTVKYGDVFKPVSKELADAVGARTVAGKHAAVGNRTAGKTKQDQVLSHMKASMVLNESYNAKAREAMLKFMGARLGVKPQQARAA